MNSGISSGGSGGSGGGTVFFYGNGIGGSAGGGAGYGRVVGVSGVSLADIPAKFGMPDQSKIAYLKKRQKEDDGSFTTVELPYQGHAEITLDLIEIDPKWKIHIVSNPDGTWLIERNAETKEAIVYGELVIHGTSRPCVGIAETHKGKNAYPVQELQKQLYSDLLRNGAMRFGISTKLWSKAEGSTPTVAEDAAPALIDPETAEMLTGHWKALEKDIALAVNKGLIALSGTNKIDQIPASLLGQVASIILNAKDDNHKVVPR